MMIASYVASIAAVFTLFPDRITCISQETSYYWSDEITTTTTSLPQEAATSPFLSPGQERPFTITSFDAILTPVFVVSSEVCNSPDVVVFPLQSMGPKINYTIDEAMNGQNSFKIDSKQRVVLLDKVNFSETQIKIIARNAEPPVSDNDSLTAIYPSPSSIRVQYENFLVIKVNIRDSLCPGSQGTTTTIVIVSLSVLCIVFLSAFSLSLIALRRSKPSLFGCKQGSNQVGPGDHSPSRLNIQNAQNGSPDAFKSSLTVNSILKPRKSSLKPSQRLPEVPEVSITCETPDSPTSPRSVYDNEAFRESSESDQVLSEVEPVVQNGTEVIALNEIPSPSLSASDSSPEKRRPSTVTFNETTQIIQIARKRGKC